MTSKKQTMVFAKTLKDEILKIFRSKSSYRAYTKMIYDK